MKCLLISSLPGKASRTLVDIARLAEIKRILDEYLLISSLPGKASRTLVDIAMLAEIKRILDEYLLISSLQGKASRTHVDITRLAQIKRILDECLLISNLPGKASLICLFCCFTSQVNSYGHGGTVSSPNHTLSWAGLNKGLPVIRAHTFAWN